MFASRTPTGAFVLPLDCKKNGDAMHEINFSIIQTKLKYLATRVTNKHLHHRQDLSARREQRCRHGWGCFITSKGKLGLTIRVVGVDGGGI